MFNKKLLTDHKMNDIIIDDPSINLCKYTILSDGTASISVSRNLDNVFTDVTEIGSGGLRFAFAYCTGITSVMFPELTTINSWGLTYAFMNCTSLTNISFPKLTNLDAWGMNMAFMNCDNLTQIHFKASIQSVVESAVGYSDKFGASYASIYFDL